MSDDRAALHMLVKLARVFKHELHQLRELMMSLQPQVQALIDAVAANNAAIGDAVTEITSIETQIAALSQKVTDLQAQIAAGTPIDAEDMAAIVQATASLTTGMASLKSAMPAPVVTPPIEPPPVEPPPAG